MNQLGSRVSVISKAKQILVAPLISCSAVVIKKRAMDCFPEEASAVSLLMHTHHPQELQKLLV